MPYTSITTEQTGLGESNSADFKGLDGRRITRRRSSAETGSKSSLRAQAPNRAQVAEAPQGSHRLEELQRPQRPQRPQPTLKRPGSSTRTGQAATFLTLRDLGKVYLADLPRLSNGQLLQVSVEAREVLASLQRRLDELNLQPGEDSPGRDSRIRAATKRDVTERFLQAIEDEQNRRRCNPDLRRAADESVARTFLELARQRLPGSTFDEMLQEALDACEPECSAMAVSNGKRSIPPVVRRGDAAEQAPEPERQPLPVVLTPDAAIETN